jgi:hypothetical protein
MVPGLAEVCCGVVFLAEIVGLYSAACAYSSDGVHLSLVGSQGRGSAQGSKSNGTEYVGDGEMHLEGTLVECD